MKNIINIVNFIRGCEPRLTVDLLEPVLHQIELSEKFSLPTTFLFQYDSLIKEEFTNLFKDLDDKYEYGCWIEFNKPLIEKAGFPWKGVPEYDWDWHTNVGFTPGYTIPERKILVDIQFDKFKEIFGFYPKSIGSWVLDAWTINYCKEKYCIDACIICKDQYGTDGYTLWGGYYNQAYYPSKNNSYLPAQNRDCQIDVPVFRMLGSDPMYQYDCFMEKRDVDVISLEPVYGCAGSDEGWVNYFFETMYKNDALGFAYAQAGQENSFGWEKMAHGYELQMKLIDKYRKEGILSVEKLSDSGRWFKENFETTPVTTIRVPVDFENRGNKVYWYDSKYYRLNLKLRLGSLIVRDIHKFDENYAEFCKDTNIDSHECKYNALPLYDKVFAFVNKSFSEFIIKSPDMTESVYEIDRENNTQTIKKDDFLLVCYENRIEISDKSGVEIKITNPMYVYEANDSELKCFYEGYEYGVKLKGAKVDYKDKVLTIKSDSKLSLIFK